jgi:hypothetical protein
MVGRENGYVERENEDGGMFFFVGEVKSKPERERTTPAGA